MLIVYNVEAKRLVLTGKGGMHFLRKSMQAGEEDMFLIWSAIFHGGAFWDVRRCVRMAEPVQMYLWVCVRENVSHVTASHLRLSCAAVTKTLNVSAACNSGGFLLFYEVCVHFRLTSCFLHPLLSKAKAWRGSSHLGGTELVMFQEGGPLPGPKSGLSSNTEMSCPRRHRCWKSIRL